MLDFGLQMLDFGLQMLDFGLKMIEFGLKMLDFVLKCWILQGCEMALVTSGCAGAMSAFLDQK